MEELASLQYRIVIIKKSLSFLKKTLNKEFPLNVSELSYLSHILGNYIVLNLHALFDNGGDVISLTTLAKRFKKDFQHSLFEDFQKAIDAFKSFHADELLRIE